MSDQNKTKEQLITELTKANEELRQSEEKYKTLVETSPDAVIMADLQGHITFASQRILQLYNSDRVEELYGKNPLDFIAPEEHQKFLKYLQQTLEEGSTKVEYTLVRKDGTRFFGVISAAVIRGACGEPKALVALIRDVSKRKEAEEALRHRSEELQAIYDGMVDGLIVADIETKKLYRANQAMCGMLGYCESELSSLAVMDLHPQDELARVLEHFETHVKKGASGFIRVPMLRKDGSIFHACISGTSITYNKRPCMIGFFRDITEQKRAEEALQKEHRTLKHLLRASDHERRLIAYDIHDGLAQQIAAAVMHLQAHGHLKDTKPQEAAKAFATGMAMLQQSHSEARRLISGVRPPILDESGVLAAIAHLVHDRNSDRGPRIELRSKVTFSRLAPVLENAIYRIVQEGLANACKHSNSEKVRVSVLQRGQHVRIEIRDSGVGFDKKSIGEERFGLEGIRQRARLLGGRCSVRSVLGRGTRITIELPLVVRE